MDLKRSMPVFTFSLAQAMHKACCCLLAELCWDGLLMRSFLSQFQKALAAGGLYMKLAGALLLDMYSRSLCRVNAALGVPARVYFANKGEEEACVGLNVQGHRVVEGLGCSGVGPMGSDLIL